MTRTRIFSKLAEDYIQQSCADSTAIGTGLPHSKDENIFLPWVEKYPYHFEGVANYYRLCDFRNWSLKRNVPVQWHSTGFVTEIGCGPYPNSDFWAHKFGGEQ